MTYITTASFEIKGDTHIFIQYTCLMFVCMIAYVKIFGRWFYKILLGFYNEIVDKTYAISVIKVNVINCKHNLEILNILCYTLCKQ